MSWNKSELLSVYCNMWLYIIINFMFVNSRTLQPYEQAGVTLSDISYTSKERQPHESVEAENDYEVLDKYSQAYNEDVKVPQAPQQELQQSTGGYASIQCSTYADYAYVPIVHGNQTSLTQPAIASQGMSGADDDNAIYEDLHPSWLISDYWVSSLS